MPNRVEKGYVGTEDLGSWQAADPVSCGSVQAGAEDLCELCGKHLYVLERFCVDGHFFHRGCFCCHTCEVTLWPGGYGQHPGDGYFYCLQHLPQEDQKEADNNGSLESQVKAKLCVMGCGKRQVSPHQRALRAVNECCPPLKDTCRQNTHCLTVSTRWGA